MEYICHEKKKRRFAQIRVLVMILAFGVSLAGCGKGGAASSGQAGKGNGQEEAGAESGQEGKEKGKKNAKQGGENSGGKEGAAGGLTLPLTEETETISVWFPFSNSYVSDPNEMPAVREMEKRTNVHVDWIPINSAEIVEKFGLLIASGDLPDIVDPTAFTSYPGGEMKSISDGVFLDCENLIETCMPNYKARITSSDALRIDAMEDDGKFHIVYYLTQSDTEISPEDDWSGLAVRKDWLDELGLEIPETIAEWENVLIAFRDEKDAGAPLTISQNAATCLNPFLTAYGVGADYMMKDGRVTFGPLEEGYRQWVELFRGWYVQGLIDPNFVTAVKNPVLNKGDEPVSIPYSSSGNGVACPVYVAAGCKNPELVAKWLDYQFSTEGMELNFYGIEGETFTKSEDGTYAYTDYIMKHPEGLSPTDAIKSFTTFIPIGMYNWQALEHYSDDTGVLASAKSTWVDQNRDLLYYTGKVSMTEEETAEYNSLYTALETLVNEKTVKYIMGTESMDTYDSFVQSLHDYGIDRCIEIKQAVYDRYRSRFEH